MRILAVVGSRRKKGNTASLVRAALEGARREGAETELVFLGDYTLRGCRGCEGCKDTYRCTVRDDMQKLYPLLLEANGLILGSPTYFYNVSADMKAFLDRLYSLEVFAENDRSCWVGLPEAMGGKYAAAIAVCEQHEEKYMGFTIEAMTKSLTDLGYRVVDTVKAVGFWGAGEVLGDQKTMRRAERAGERLVRTFKLRKQIEGKLRETKF